MRLPVNGVTLNVELAGRGRPLLLLHGFTGSAAGWAQHAVAFARQARVIAVDLLGHGLSEVPETPARYTVEHGVQDLLALLDRLDVQSADLLGYSMGGRLALRLAIVAPERCGRLVLESASPGIADPLERAARVVSDEALAASIERAGLGVFVEQWERQPLFASQSSLPAEVRAGLRAERLRNSPRGLASNLRGMGTGRQEPLWDKLQAIRAPTLIIVGQLDDRYRQLGAAMEMVISSARLAIVPHAGHAVHLEQPAAFQQLVTGFLFSPGPDPQSFLVVGAGGCPPNLERQKP